MKKYARRVCALVLAALCLCAGASAEHYDGFSYDCHYVIYDAPALAGWGVMEYAEYSGVLMSMYSDTAEVSVQLAEKSDTPTLDDLASQRLRAVDSYGMIVTGAEQTEWYAPWLDSEPGMRLTYTYAFEGGEGIYQVADYMAPLNDQQFVVVELTDRSGDIRVASASLESGFLESFSIGSFTVNGSMSAYLTDASEQNGKMALTLQPFDVQLSEDQFDYSVTVTGDPVTLTVADDARLLAPAGDDSGLLAALPLTAQAADAFIAGYRAQNGKDCIFNVLLCDGEIRWMTYSYLY